MSDLEKVGVAERAAQENINSQITSKHLRKVLAARVVFLQLAIQADGILQEKHKRIWLLFQLSDTPIRFSTKPHPFVWIINRCLGHASSTALDALVVRFGGIRCKHLQSSRFILGRGEAQCGPSESTPVHLYHRQTRAVFGQSSAKWLKSSPSCRSSSSCQVLVCR